MILLTMSASHAFADSTAAAVGSATAMNGSSSISAPNQSITFNSPDKVEYSGSYKVRTAPDAPTVLASPTAPCRVAIGASGSFLGGSLGMSGSVMDEGCDAREDARLLHNLGQTSAAIGRLCMKPEMAKALGNQCDKPGSAAAAPATAVVTEYKDVVASSAGIFTSR